MGQLSIWQLLLSARAGHLYPPWAAWVTMERERPVVPLPQDLEQVDQAAKKFVKQAEERAKVAMEGRADQERDLLLIRYDHS